MTSAADRLRELASLFDSAARKADAWPIHWMSGGDAGPDWCYPCCRAVARHYRRINKTRDPQVDGGWDNSRESDGPSYCASCGRLLGYHLSRYGLSEEIEHWLQDGDPNHLTLDQAYEVHAILDGASEIGEEADMLNAVAIGERMLPLLCEAT